MNKKFFLVIGPESSGNHLTSLVLKTMGCYWEVPQKLDKYLDGELQLKDITNNPNLVLLRSVPHGREWPNIDYINERFSIENYKVYTIFLKREFMATVLSNYYHRSPTVEVAWETLIKAEKHLALYMQNMDNFYVLNTSALMKDPEPVVRGLELYTGLKWPDGVSYESIIKDSDIGRHQLLLDHGFKSIDRKESRKYIARPNPLVIRKREKRKWEEK